ncbi:MAG: helix-turn-helix domain-containing protein [Candidatus Omnitrophica bacterium]|nr:helix-turn-helix domain-containing protein [Candidatus Omnitrophota bacterium]MDD5436506.1 helix-turn-helix domain-containing protein [Candidatus Omnitrophota bacterium]
MPEKLMSIKEVAEHLKISEEEVKRLVDTGEIPAYKIGDTFLRFRREQIDAIRTEISEIEEEEVKVHPPAPGHKGRPAHPYTDLEKDIKRKEPATRRYDYTVAERVKDFFYFNDFYIVSFLLIISLIYLIIKT